MIEYLLVIAILSTAMFYLGSRAIITRWLWSTYSPRFAAFMDCPACTGFWWGMAWSFMVAPPLGANFTGSLLAAWTAHGVIGLAMITLTPICAGIMQAGFDRLGTIAASDGEQT